MSLWDGSAGNLHLVCESMGARVAVPGVVVAAAVLLAFLVSSADAVCPAGVNGFVTVTVGTGRDYSSLQAAADDCLGGTSGYTDHVIMEIDPGVGSEISAIGWHGITVTRGGFTVRAAAGKLRPRLSSSSDTWLTVDVDNPARSGPVVLQDLVLFSSFATSPPAETGALLSVSFPANAPGNVTLDGVSIDSASLLPSARRTGVRVARGDHVLISNGVFAKVENVADSLGAEVDFAGRLLGAVVLADVNSATVTNTTFSSCNAFAAGDQFVGSALVIKTQDSLSAPVGIYDCAFLDNNGVDGSALHLSGTAMRAEIINSSFEDNTHTTTVVGTTGTVKVKAAASLLVQDCQFVHNSAPEHAGLVVSQVGHTNLTSSVFKGNVITSASGDAASDVSLFETDADVIDIQVTGSGSKLQVSNQLLFVGDSAHSFHMQGGSVTKTALAEGTAAAVRVIDAGDAVIEGVVFSEWGNGPAIWSSCDRSAQPFDVQLRHLHLHSNALVIGPAVMLDYRLVGLHENPSIELSSITMHDIQLSPSAEGYTASSPPLSVGGAVAVLLPLAQVASLDGWQGGFDVTASDIVLRNMTSSVTINSGTSSFLAGTGISILGYGLNSLAVEDIRAEDVHSSAAAAILGVESLPAALHIINVTSVESSGTIGGAMMYLINNGPCAECLPADQAYNHYMTDITILDVNCGSGPCLRYELPAESISSQYTNTVYLEIDGLSIQDVSCISLGEASPLSHPSSGCGVQLVHLSEVAPMFKMSVRIINSEFLRIDAADMGGAAVAVPNGNAETGATYVGLIAVDFEDCLANMHGGAVHAVGTWLDVFDCSFRRCATCSPDLPVSICTNGSPSDDHAGGAIYSLNNNPGDTLPTLIAYTTFAECTSAGMGGAVALVQADGSNITNSQFTDNVAHVGGGALSIRAVFDQYRPSDQPVEVHGCDFHRNEAVGGGGGASHVDTWSVVMSRSRFINNTASTDGGGSMWFASTVVASVVSKCEYRGNAANRGGGITSLSSNVEVDGSSMYSNTATSDGGAFACVSPETGPSYKLVVHDDVAASGNIAYGSPVNETTHFIMCERCAECFECYGCNTELGAECCSTRIGGCCCKDRNIIGNGATGIDLTCEVSFVAYPVAAVIGVALSIVVVVAMMAALLYRSFLRNRVADVGDEILDPKFDPASARGAVLPSREADLSEQRKAYL